MTARPVPQWFDDAKLGIFVHWTAAAVPAFAPVGPLAVRDRRRRGRGGGLRAARRTSSGTRTPSPSTAARWPTTTPSTTPTSATRRSSPSSSPATPAGTPTPWADLFGDGGARYVVLVTKHHDGVTLWPTRHAQPVPRRLVGRAGLRRRRSPAAVRDRGPALRHLLLGRPRLDLRRAADHATSVDVGSAIPQSPEYVAYADAHWRELIDRYQPCVLWNDIGYPGAGRPRRALRPLLRRVPDGIVNDRFDLGRQPPDRATPTSSRPSTRPGAPETGKWEATRGIGTQFGYNRIEPATSYLSVADAGPAAGRRRRPGAATCCSTSGRWATGASRGPGRAPPRPRCLAATPTARRFRHAAVVGGPERRGARRPRRRRMVGRCGSRGLQRTAVSCGRPRRHGRLGRSGATVAWIGRVHRR